MIKNRIRNWSVLVLFLTVVVPQKLHAFAVATGTIWASEAAIEILKKGGNATDAMVAASFALNVTQPYNMGIGGGGFYLVHTGDKTYYWDHRETAPASAHEKMFLDSNGKPIPYEPERITGPNPVGVPGTVAGLYEAHRKLGKLPWKTLLQPAIKLAKQGFPVTKVFEEKLHSEWERISAFPTTAAQFGDGQGGPLKTGQVLRQPLLAQTLERIAKEGARSFYEGALAKSWLTEAQKFGVKITLDDLKKYKVRAAKPIEYKVFGLKAVTSSPPSASGLMVAASLRFLENYYKTHSVPSAGSAERVVVTTETLKYFQDLRNRTIADPPHGTLDPQKFLGSKDEKAAWVEIEKNITARLDRIQTRFTQTEDAPEREPASEAQNHTAHLSIIDDQGMAVSYTTTIEQWFGSGIVVTGHGFLLNNELSDFNPEPGHPNSPAPGKRPRSNMSPTLLFEKGKPVGVVGCAGGGRIPTTIVNMLENYYLHKMTAREAIAFARFHPSGDTLEVEASIHNSELQRLKDAGYNVETTPSASTAQALLRRDLSQKWEAASDPRSDGLGLSW